MEETKKLSCIDCNVKKCNAKQNIENNKPYPGFCVSHNMDLKDRQQWTSGRNTRCIIAPDWHSSRDLPVCGRSAEEVISQTLKKS